VHLFTRNGYAGTSMKQLAAELGMVPANLYNYYPKKEAILFDVLSHQLSSLLERDSRIVEDNPDPVDRIKAFAYDLVIEDLRNPLAAFVGQQGVNGLTRSGREKISRMMGKVRELWIQAVTDGVTQKKFVTADPKLSTLTILTLCSSTSAWFHPDREYSAEHVADYTATCALRILGCTTSLS
jgi:TetR/AcrR family transcriptional regulator, cholesterol catabolism regulator